MDVFERNGYVVEFDAEATRAAYLKVASAGADVCTCDTCLNFARQRAAAYPEAFVALLRSLGIDPLKEDEAYECGKDETGQYSYGGWLHFVGRVLQVGQEIELDGFRYWFDKVGQTPQPNEAFSSEPVAAIEFMTHLAWVIDKPEPDSAPTTTSPRFWQRVARRLHLVKDPE
jgi:hypothetical protein